MRSYTPIEPVEVLGQRAEGRIIKLDGNENSYGCSPKVYQALANYPYYHIYPDPEQRKLRQALEKYTGFDQKSIICGSGSDELIDLVLRLFLQPGDEVINCSPSFGMYPFSTAACGGKLVDVPRDKDFAMDIAGVKKALSEKAKIIFIASPNNPTGNLVTKQEVTELVNTGSIVVVDEAYFEFSGVTMANLVLDYSNLIVLRTFSKWAGLAGLRIGYGIFSVEIAGHLMKIKQPYNVSAAAQAAVLASLADMDYLRSNVAKIVAERERLFSKLEELKWLTPYPSRANFVLCSVHCRADSLHYHSEGTKQVKKLAQGKLSGESPAREIWQRLQERGVFIRYFDSPQLRDYLRISVGKPEDTEALIEALREIELGGI